MKQYTLGLYEKAMPNELTLREKLDTAARCGFDRLELSVDESEEKLSRLEKPAQWRRELAVASLDAGVPVTTLCLSGHRKYPLGSHDPAVRRRSLEIMEGALALGAGKTRVVLGMVLPCAMPGILTAVILGMGRIVGESAALLFTSGIATNMPDGVLSHVMSSGRTLTLHLYQTATEATDPAAFQIAYATAAVLLILVFILNRLAGLLSRVLRKG